MGTCSPSERQGWLHGGPLRRGMESHEQRGLDTSLCTPQPRARAGLQSQETRSAARPACWLCSGFSEFTRKLSPGPDGYRQGRPTRHFQHLAPPLHSLLLPGQAGLASRFTPGVAMIGLMHFEGRRCSIVRTVHVC